MENIKANVGRNNKSCSDSLLALLSLGSGLAGWPLAEEGLGGVWKQTGSSRGGPVPGGRVVPRKKSVRGGDGPSEPVRVARLVSSRVAPKESWSAM